MTRQKGPYSSQDFGQTAIETAKDRLHDMADAAGGKVKDVASSAQEMAGDIADQAANTASRRRRRRSRSGLSSRNPSRSSPWRRSQAQHCSGSCSARSGRSRATNERRARDNLNVRSAFPRVIYLMTNHSIIGDQG